MSDSEYAEPSGSRFPMQDGPAIDQQTALEIYRVYACLHGPGQTLERIGERGGFGWSEVALLWKRHDQQKARRMCRCANIPPQPPADRR